MTEHAIATVEELGEEGRLVAEIEGREICVFKRGDDLYAYLNWCPHQSGPACEGPVHGKWEASYDRESLDLEKTWIGEDAVINCPWHGWQFDFESGECLSDPSVALPSYPVSASDGEIVVSL